MRILFAIVLLLLSHSPLAELDAYVSSSCPMGLGTFWTYYEAYTTGDTYLVDLENANRCKVNEVVEL